MLLILNIFHYLTLSGFQDRESESKLDWLRIGASNTIFLMAFFTLVDIQVTS